MDYNKFKEILKRRTPEDKELRQAKKEAEKRLPKDEDKL
jgi:hypothetical protein